MLKHKQKAQKFIWMPNLEVNISIGFLLIPVHSQKTWREIRGLSKLTLHTTNIF